MCFTFRVNGVAGIDLWLTLAWFVLGFRSRNPRLSRCFSITTFLIQRIQPSSGGLNIFTFSIRGIQYIFQASIYKIEHNWYLFSYLWLGRSWPTPIWIPTIIFSHIFWWYHILWRQWFGTPRTHGRSIFKSWHFIIFFSIHQYMISSYNLKMFCTFLNFLPKQF